MYNLLLPWVALCVRFRVFELLMTNDLTLLWKEPTCYELRQYPVVCLYWLCNTRETLA